MGAFEKYLLSIPRGEAVAHVIVCLASGGEMAWDLIARFNGENWKCPPAELKGLIAKTLDQLEASER